MLIDRDFPQTNVSQTKSESDHFDLKFPFQITENPAPLTFCRIEGGLFHQFIKRFKKRSVVILSVVREKRSPTADTPPFPRLPPLPVWERSSGPFLKIVGIHVIVSILLG